MDFIELVESYKDDIVKSTQEIVRIKSVEGEGKPGMPFGEGPYNALKYALDIAEDMGFKTKNLDGYAGHADFGEGDETIGILVHLDVVPEGDGWTYPPYSGEIHDGKIFGRGTLDDKGPAIASLYAMKALKEANVSLNKKIRIIFGTNEETGWGCMKYYFEHEKAPDMAFTPDADFPVIHGEKGIIAFDLVKKIENNSCGDISIKSIKGGNAVNMVPDYCEAILEVKDMDYIENKLKNFKEKNDYDISIEEKDGIVKVIAKGSSAHGSTPEKGENAITYLMLFLGEILDCNCDICDFIKIYNEKIALKHNGEGIGCGFEDEVSGKLNFNPGVIKTEDGKITLSINIRYPIKSSSEEVYNGIRKELEGTGIELIEDDDEMKPIYVPKNDPLVEKLMKVYKEETGDLDSEPITIGGGTYARAMDNAVAFGPVFPGQEEVAHQKDEYISIEHLMKMAKIYAKALYELAK
ncbi:dipeptidase PepV [Anaerosalibacter bizertensis]|uniref:Dipeptidase PepV n=1 Tax=Anaerosalibacter bizertensis TaxID=932217 RepID=A0A844FIR2_9FIRM|nr:dipeptidase PepV [Anaerosalibacter bizertensis]MBV1819646.1 dipeptidase PepV [Bacteroidales bacterium MSK.15.36]HHV25839.1 dipeptidase PepV [Tissierellia bacterium]MCB5560295.1 dipeptidase PepV [Anaerosalibacter bizertensis]MCG4565883.1 dipeptidase PepV [Anaerosalibacter bizertensis]MCG4583227.1 dipeptidase PepV [Anaerosalibacter bizertensis]